MHPFEIFAYLIVAAVALVLALMLKRQLAAIGFEARREAGELELLQLQLETTRKARERAEEAAGPWNSWRKFRVAKKVHEVGDICSFYLAPHDRKPLPQFRPGQYLTFSFDGIPGQDKPAVRCYSLSDCYHPGHYRISVKRVPRRAMLQMPHPASARASCTTTSKRARCSMSGRRTGTLPSTLRIRCRWCSSVVGLV